MTLLFLSKYVILVSIKCFDRLSARLVGFGAICFCFHILLSIFYAFMFFRRMNEMRARNQ